jgi:glyoxylase-like metal-dependent hydrolase (beta-lactamase superfamily II)
MNDTVTIRPNQGWDPRILVCACGTLVDTFIVLTERYVVIVDTMLNGTTAQALLAIAREYQGRRQLLAVNTHADWDHAWGNHVLAGANAEIQVPIIGSRRCAARLRHRAARAELAHKRATEPGRFDDVQLTPPTILFDDALAITGGDLTLQLFATPGHTADHSAIFIPQIATLLAGDAAELPFPFVESASAIPQMRASLERMAALNPAVALYCHAPVTSGPKALEQNIAYFATLEHHCRAALAQGAPARPPADADVEVLVSFPYAAAVPIELDAEALAGFYRPGHQAAIRMMLEYLDGSSA